MYAAVTCHHVVPWLSDAHGAPLLQNTKQDPGRVSQPDQDALQQRIDSNATASGQDPKRPKVILGASGSVAAIKVMELAHLLAAFAEVKVVATKAARHFIQEDELPVAARPMHGNDFRIMIL